MKLGIFTSWSCSDCKEMFDKTIRCTCKVVDLLIKLIDWPYYAFRIRRRSRLAVVSSTLSIQLYFTCLKRRCLFETESQDTRILSCFGPWKFLKAYFSIMSLKFRCQARHPSEKYCKIRKIQLTGKRIFHKGDHLTRWCE